MRIGEPGRPRPRPGRRTARLARMRRTARLAAFRISRQPFHVKRLRPSGRSYLRLPLRVSRETRWLRNRGGLFHVKRPDDLAGRLTNRQSRCFTWNGRVRVPLPNFSRGAPRARTAGPAQSNALPDSGSHEEPEVDRYDCQQDWDSKYQHAEDRMASESDIVK